MSNTKLKEGLGEIAREVAVLPGISFADAAYVGQKIMSISAKIDMTNGLDTSAWTNEFAALNPKASSSAASGAAPEGIVGLLAALPVLGQLAPGTHDWLSTIGIGGHEQELDEEQGSHSDTLDGLHDNSCDCADSVNTIDETADNGMQSTIDVILDLIAALKDCPLVELGSVVLTPIVEGLLSIEGTVDDRNDAIGECYDGMKQLCDDAENAQPPAPKQYAPPAASPAAAPACPVAAAEPASAPAAAPVPAPEQAHVPSPAPAPEPATAPAPTPPEVPTAPAMAAAGGGGVNITVNVDVNMDVGCAQAESQMPPVGTLPAQCLNPAIPAPPAVPPVGPAGDCVVKQVVAGLEAFGQMAAECLEQVECPVEPEPEQDCPEEPPVPEPEPAPEPDPAPEPAPEPDTEPVAQTECPEDEGTITPPPELAEVKEPPPPPKKGLVEPMAVSGAEPVEQAPVQVEQPDEQDDQQRARTTGGW